MSVKAERAHAIAFDAEKCVGCVACSKVCPTNAIRVKNGLAEVKFDLCIDCGYCVRVCEYDAVHAVTSSSSDLEKFKYIVAMPSQTLYGQFKSETHPSQILNAFKRVGFDAYYDISWMCEMLGGATDAYLSECAGPWPKVSATCPAVVRLIQLRYPDMIQNLVRLEAPRELAAKVLRRRLSTQLGLEPREIGIFFITPCSAIMNSIVSPVGMEESYLDGAFSISELYGDLFEAVKKTETFEVDDQISVRGMKWAMAGGEIAGMRNANTITASGGRDVKYVFDHIEAGKFQGVDFIEAYICPDGCISGQLVVENRFLAQRRIQLISKRLGEQDPVKEEKVRSLLRGHFFDLEEEIASRKIQSRVQDLKQAIADRKEMEALLEQLPKKDCAACGAPDCATLAEDIVKGEAKTEDCVFIRLECDQKNIAGHEEDKNE